MRRVSLEFVEPGMKLGRSIYNANGKVMLSKGVTLHPYYLARLQELGIQSIYVEERIIEVPVAPQVVSEVTVTKTIEGIKETFQTFERAKRLNIVLIQGMVDDLITELLANQHFLYQLTDLKIYDDYTFEHSVNTCILSLMLGISAQYDQIRLKQLGVGALLHDIGKTRIDKTLLLKPGELTPEEYMQIQRHTQYGFEILRDYEEVSLLSAHVALQHHERWKGGGYPRNLNGNRIHEFALIVTVADTFDALTSDRPYRKAYSNDQALGIMRTMTLTHFNPKYMSYLITNVAAYPIGTWVLLNTGNVGIITETNRKNSNGPVLRLVFNKEGQYIKDKREVDLSEMTTIRIVHILAEEEIARFLKITRERTT